MKESIEDRLQRLEDIIEIQQLFIDYGNYLDAGEFDKYAGLFAVEGEVKLGPIGRAKGREAIQAMMSKTLGDNLGTSYHLISNPMIALDGDAASSEVMWTVVMRGDDGQPYISMQGRHKDKLIREEGRWRFLQRRGFVDIPCVMPG